MLITLRNDPILATLLGFADEVAIAVFHGIHEPCGNTQAIRIA
jgi:hypothetical protein